MHHLYPSSKGDPLCPLGFHPQVRWPTRCKRCFRDYKEHGGKKRDEDISLRRDDSTASSPSLNSWGINKADEHRRSWASSTSLAPQKDKDNSVVDFGTPASWISTPDLAKLEDDTQANIPTVSFTLPKRRSLPIDKINRTSSDTVTLATAKEKSPIFNKNDSLSARSKKLKAIKDSVENRPNRIQVKEVKSVVDENTNHDVQFLIQVKSKSAQERKLAKQTGATESDEDAVSIAATETTETTLVGDSHEDELQEQIEQLTGELETLKTKCERLEREKSDILLRRIAAMETTASKTTATEVLKLQQRCNELQGQVEDLIDEKKSLKYKVKELEDDLEMRPSVQAAQKVSDELRSKLLAAETLCEELMDENEDMKKELRNLEEEMEELQDNFREDQANEYSSLKKELEQTTKNCRILSFKLRKTERKTEQLEMEKGETEKKLREVAGGGNNNDKIKQLELDLVIATENSLRLQKELEETNFKLKEALELNAKPKTPMLGSIPKASSAEKVSRESLTRGGSQDDPIKLQRDLQDSLEREADLREQLKFSEEELNSSKTILPNVHRRPLTFTETFSFKTKVNKQTQTDLLDMFNTGCQTTTDCYDKMQQTNDVENFFIQKSPLVVKSSIESRRFTMLRMYQPASSFSPMATLLTPILGRRTSPNRLTPEPPNEKDEGIADTEDPAELRLLLELNEQEAAVLRKKVEELEAEKDTSKKKIKDLQDKLENQTLKRSILGTVKGTTKPDQKLKVLEDEANTLKQKLTEREQEINRLQAELNLTQKRSKGLQKSKSLDLDQQTVDLKRQLQLIEQEALVFRTKIQTLESENEKLNLENKKLQLARGTKITKMEKSTEKYVDKIAELEVELEYASKKIKELQQRPGKSNKLKLSNETNVLEQELSQVLNERDNLADVILKIKQGSKYFKDKPLKKPLESATKVQLKNMVNDLEKEIGNIFTLLNNYEESSLKLTDGLKQDVKTSSTKKLSDLEDLIKSKQFVENQLSEEKRKCEELKKLVAKHAEEKKELENKINSAKEQQQKIIAEKERTSDEILTIKMSTQEQLLVYKQQTENLLTELAQKDRNYETIWNDIIEKDKIILELNGKCEKMDDIEKKLDETKTKMKKFEKQSKDQIKQISSMLEAEREKNRIQEKEQHNLSVQCSEDKKTLDLQINKLKVEIESLENIISSKEAIIQQLEQSLKKEREAASSLKVDINSKELRQVKDELNKKNLLLSEIESKLANTINDKKMLDDNYKKMENSYKKDIIALDKKAADLNVDLQNERTKLDTLKTNQDKENKNRDTEIEKLKDKLKESELNYEVKGIKKINDIKKEYQVRIEKMEFLAIKQKEKCDDLTAKYEILEEEHVAIKAKLVNENETLSNQLSMTKNQLEVVQKELDHFKTLNNNYLQEKGQLEEKVKHSEKYFQKGSESFMHENGRLKMMLEEKVLQLEQLKKEHDVINDQLEYIRKENDDLKSKLDDYNKVSKIQRNIGADTSAMEEEIRQLRSRLINAEKLRKTDVTECKMRYDNQITIFNEQLQSLQLQVTRFKREKDTYKHMLEAAQKTIGELKISPLTRRNSKTSLTSYDEIEESKTKIATLEQQISCMEDELSETRLEASKFKTELVSERSSWEIKIAELQSRINELEEERILSSGRTKIPGLKTRMELAWQKEREEQQRLLQETSTLARDLRQTLFEVERERDKERLDSKRKQEQLKKNVEDDQEENRRKLNELQCDLMELRDAHAKLRTTNEKLRREKDRTEKEREEYRSLITTRKRTEQEDERRINALLEQVEVLLRFSSDLVESTEGSTEKKSVYSPTPPRRYKNPKSRESSPTFTKDSSIPPEDRKTQINSAMTRLRNITEELQKYQRKTEEVRDRERIKRSMGLRRATSTEHDTVPDSTKTNKHLIRNGNTTSSLQRRSLSLEHNIQEEQPIWKNEDSLSSLQSLDEATDLDVQWSKRDASLDSRLSGGSTQSETGGTERKKKKSLMGKLKKLTKSRSIDDQDPENFSPTGTLLPKVNADVADDNKGSRKDLRDRITGIFKKTGSSSRSNSLERRTDKTDSSSRQRPLMPNGSNSSISSEFPSPEQNVVSVKSKKSK